MECPSSPECVAPARGDSDRGSVCDGVGMDGKREHQLVREGKSQRGSFGTCEFLSMILTSASYSRTITVAWGHH